MRLELVWNLLAYLQLEPFTCSLSGGKAMRDYRAYVIGQDGLIRQRFEFFCEDDEKAKEEAKQYVDGHDVELWHRDHRIVVLRHKQPGRRG